MRPVTLTVQGLHSFREKQTIDFSTLCQGGVFGIFGPTGSGKSSLLDAMTLALYGKVERAYNNTQGIMNQAEQSVYVSFTFELGKKGRSVRYTVERRYVRSHEFNVKTSVCRLTEHKQEDSVLADKANDVNKCVEALLGLTIDDFTRAVVLPQGKFSDFLKLRGTERRKMLQRIFHLEKYGDELMTKIKSSLQAVKHEREKMEAEQTGLGDASKEAVQQAKSDLAYWERELESAVSKKEAIDRAFEEMKQIRYWQEEKAAAAKRLSRLKEREPVIHTYQADMQTSNEAEALLPFAKALLQAESDTKEWAASQKERTEAWKNTVVQEENLQKEWDVFQQQQEKALAHIRQVQQMIYQAEQLQQELLRYQEEKTALEKEYRALQQKNHQWHEQQKELLKKKQTSTDGLAALEQRYDALAATREEKNQLIEAIQHKQQIEHLISQSHTLISEKNQQKQQLDTLLEEKRTAEEKTISLQEKTAARFSQLSYWYNKARADHAWLNDTTQLLERKWKEEMEKENHRKLQAMSQTLARELTEYAPCPVCGSTSHPSPALVHASNETSISHTDSANLESWKKSLEAYLMTVQQREWYLEQQAASISNVIDSDMLSSAEDLNEEVPVLSLDDDWQTILQQKIKQWDSEEKTIAALAKAVGGELQEYQNQRERLKQKQYAYEHALSEYQRTLDKITPLEEKKQDLQTAWHRRFAAFRYEEVEKKYEQMLENEKQQEILSQRIEKGKTYIERLVSEQEEVANHIQQLEIEASNMEAKLDERKERVTEKHQELEHILQGDTVNEWKRYVEEHSRQWENKAKLLKENLDDITAHKHKVEQQKAVSEHAYHESARRLETARTEWENKTKHTTEWSDPNEVEQAILSDTQKREYEEKIKTYEKEWQQWSAKYQELCDQLDSRAVSDEEWQEWQEKQHAIHEQVDSLREKRGAAFTYAEELKQKHQHYEHLEKQKQSVIEKETDYQKLESVFKGKGFVEFLAEEQLIHVSRLASSRLRALTNGRYAIEVDSGGGFIVRDDANGGIKRPVTTLSGGETFLTSLALALALSLSIQLKGEHPLEFFFLDEGFGTLDQELLDTVMTALEKLQMEDLSVGVISHVPELQERLAKKIYVKPAEPGGAGSRVYIEKT
ncbi:exonuclease SbcC [Alteribacillus persepolensis]|uniref:Nuclease SbcCD subunit C n=1 Tax=Alteribacillus persepolensis TaxID=568899 RepID=A0A1G7Z7S7_9BACI|nr:SMC family ATPase [Alteribacillus persepolensis]SDH04812.1 exonuclease SbcC [Alteribacillus persepolensis]